MKFVDYGDTGSVNNSDLKHLKKEYIELPAQAIACCLNNIEPAPSGQWMEDATNAFEELVFDKNLSAEVSVTRKIADVDIWYRLNDQGFLG